MPRQRGCSPFRSPSTGLACTARCWCAAGATHWAARCGTTPPSQAMTSAFWSSVAASRAWRRPARPWRWRSGAGWTNPAAATGSSCTGPCWPTTAPGGWAARCWFSSGAAPTWRPCGPARPTRGPGCMGAWRSTTGSSAGATKADELRSIAVGVVVVPPLVRRGLRVPLRQVLPFLLAAERGDVQVVPGVPHLLVAAGGDEVGAEDLVALADERVGAVPLIDVEVPVEVVGDRVPGDVLPSVALLQALDLGLGGARGEHQRRVPRVQVGGVRDLVGDERAAHARPLRIRAALGVGGDLGPIEGTVDDQLTSAVEEVGQARHAVGPVELVRLVHGQPWHPPTLGGERFTGAGQLLFLHEQCLARSFPLLRRHDRRALHADSSQDSGAEVV